MQPTDNKLNGTPFMVYSVTHYLELHKVMIIPYYRFYVLPKKKLNKLYGLYFMKTYILNQKKLVALRNPYSKCH